MRLLNFLLMNKESLSGNGSNYLIPAMSYESIKGNSKRSVWFEELLIRKVRY